MTGVGVWLVAGEATVNRRTATASAYGRSVRGLLVLTRRHARESVARVLTLKHGVAERWGRLSERILSVRNASRRLTVFRIEFFPMVLHRCRKDRLVGAEIWAMGQSRGLIAATERIFQR